MTTRKYGCMCGAFEAEVTGDPALACWCHCQMCRKQTGAAMQLGVWTPDNFKVLKGDEKLIKYSSTEGKVYRNSCSTCGSFCYKVLPDGALVAPLGALEPVVPPTCHIFVKDKGEQPVMFPELPQHDAFP
uniref:CENP-V/GFA domain-containing protein n=1 Tax=Amphora coffeiformis TaxID=265554 RepID=A0A7S3P825_9STRA